MVDDGIGADGADLDRAAAEARMAAIVRGLEYHEYDGTDPPRRGGGCTEFGAGQPSRGAEASAGVYEF